MLELGIDNGVNLDDGRSTALVESDGSGGARLIDSQSGSFGVVER